MDDVKKLAVSSRRAAKVLYMLSHLKHVQLLLMTLHVISMKPVHCMDRHVHATKRAQWSTKADWKE